MNALIALEDGTIYRGSSFGADGERVGEIVFNTSMAGYQEILTDPSYHEQIVTMTYPLIGNYGVCPEDMESHKIYPPAFLIKEYNSVPSNFRSTGTLADFLKEYNVLGVQGIDTLDPPPLGTVNLEEAKATYGDMIFFKGNLDAVNEVLHADEDTFEQAVKNRLRIGRPGSGYILSSACSVAPHVEPRRLRRLVELAEEFGRY